MLAAVSAATEAAMPTTQEGGGVEAADDELPPLVADEAPRRIVLTGASTQPRPMPELWG